MSVTPRTDSNAPQEGETDRSASHRGGAFLAGALAAFGLALAALLWFTQADRVFIEQAFAALAACF